MDSFLSTKVIRICSKIPLALLSLVPLFAARRSGSEHPRMSLSYNVSFDKRKTTYLKMIFMACPPSVTAQ